jgi:DNA-binding NarL/FixJ family response regulator
MKRVVIVDDHVAIRKMLVVFLRRETGYEVVGETGSGLEALSLCAELHPDLVILDLMLLELSGAEVIHRIREQSPTTKVLIYSGTQNLAAIRRCLQAEPDGFVEKFDDINVLREGLKSVTAGRKYFTALPAGLLNKLRYEKLDLTEREVEILQLIAEGQFSKEIASRLQISFKTVENHRSSLMHKINARNMADITRYAMRAGLIE